MNHPNHIVTDLPEDLGDVMDRLTSGEPIYGFELELLADFISQ